jgi:hypothetical protein
MARRIERMDLSIEKSERWLLLGKVPGIGTWRRIRFGQRRFAFSAELSHAGIAEATRGVRHDQR